MRQTADPIASYVAELRSYLDGPWRAKRDVLREVRHGLIDAAEGWQTGGLGRDEAAHRALAEFGTPRELARQFQPELAARQTITALLYIAAFGPLGQISSQVVWSRTPMPDDFHPDRTTLVLAAALDWLGWGASVIAMVMVLAVGLGARRAPFSPRVARGVGVGMSLTLSAIAVGGVVLTRAFMLPDAGVAAAWPGQAQLGAFMCGWLAVGWMAWRCLRVARRAERLGTV